MSDDDIFAHHLTRQDGTIVELSPLAEQVLGRMPEIGERRTITLTRLVRLIRRCEWSYSALSSGRWIRGVDDEGGFVEVHSAELSYFNPTIVDPKDRESDQANAIAVSSVLALAAVVAVAVGRYEYPVRGLAERDGTYLAPDGSPFFFRVGAKLPDGFVFSRM